MKLMSGMFISLFLRKNHDEKSRALSIEIVGRQMDLNSTVEKRGLIMGV